MTATRRALLGLITLARGIHGKSLQRLYTPQPLVNGGALSLSDGQRHYLLNVMRAKEGDELSIFNGADGEWTAAVSLLNKKRCDLQLLEQARPQPSPAAAGPCLLFGVLKGARLSTLVEKACELGAGSLQPVVTQYCAVRSLNVQRLQDIAIEAAEQSRRLTVPTVAEAQPLAAALDAWDAERPLIVCDERGDGAPPLSALLADGTLDAGAAPGVLIGPEGGFSPEEFEALAARPFVRTVSLGANTLRAETAAMAALAVLGCR